MNLHPDWKSEPSAPGPFQRVFDKGKGKEIDLYVTYVFGDGIDGKRYCRAVEATGRMIKNGGADEKLKKVLNTVRERGPSYCLAVTEGGRMPTEADHSEQFLG